MVPIFGGRLWTTLTTASLLIPALGIGFAVQDPETPYVIFLILALLCGFGGGNFASSMSNISFFFPKKEKGNALACLGRKSEAITAFKSAAKDGRWKSNAEYRISELTKWEGQ